MSFLSNLIKKAVPIVATVAPGTPIGTAAAVISYGQAKQEESYQRKLAEQRQIKRQKEINAMEFDIRGTGLKPGFDYYGMPGKPVQTGFGSGFGTFLSDVGANIVNPLSSIFSSVRPFISQQSAGQPALPTSSTSGGRESALSGSREAFVGGIPNILGQAARLLRTPAGSVGTGLAGGIGASLLGGGSGGMRITRKMKSQYRAVLNLAQGDYDQAAAMIGVSTDMFISVLLKRFRNDGPVVTKAALRKTKTTVRRLKSMCDMYDSLRPTATRRKAPMRRASTTLISNK